MSSSKQEGGKVLSARLLSRERSSVANASFRVYYSLGAAGTVPFVWETKPGTPKSALAPASAAAADDALPPISPPPSYQSSSSQFPKIKNRFSRRPSSSWPTTRGGWTSWLNIRTRLSPSPPSAERDRWLGTDGGEHRRRPRHAIRLCF